MTEIKIKRVYEPYNSQDGCRISVDRFRPRRGSKTNAHMDRWAKKIAPSAEIRKNSITGTANGILLLPPVSEKSGPTRKLPALLPKLILLRRYPAIRRQKYRT